MRYRDGIAIEYQFASRNLSIDMIRMFRGKPANGKQAEFVSFVRKIVSRFASNYSLIFTSRKISIRVYVTVSCCRHASLVTIACICLFRHELKLKKKITIIIISCGYYSHTHDWVLAHTHLQCKWINSFNWLGIRRICLASDLKL